MPIVYASQDVRLEDAVATWTVAGVTAFFQAADFPGDVQVLKHNDVNGADFLAMTVEVLHESFKVSRFLAEKVIAARQRHLEGICV